MRSQGYDEFLSSLERPVRPGYIRLPAPAYDQKKDEKGALVFVNTGLLVMLAIYKPIVQAFFGSKNHEAQHSLRLIGWMENMRKRREGSVVRGKGRNEADRSESNSSQEINMNKIKEGKTESSK